MANYYPSPDFTGQDGSFTGNLDVDGTLNADGNTTLGGTLGVTGATALTGAISMNGGAYNGGKLTATILTPTNGALAGDTSDLVPDTGLATMFMRLSATGAARKLYSIAGYAAQQLLCLINWGANDVTLVHDNGSNGTAAYRFYCPNNVDYVMKQNSAVWTIYDGGTGRIRVLGPVA
jgi:hypothetical protein